MPKRRKPSSEQHPPITSFNEIEELNRKRLDLVFSAADQTKQKLLGDVEKAFNATYRGGSSSSREQEPNEIDRKAKVPDKSAPEAPNESAALARRVADIRDDPRHNPQMSVAEAACMLQRSKSTVHRLVEEGKLVSKRGRIVTSSVLKYLGE